MLLPNLLQVVLSEDWRSGGFGLYIHWPFCLAKCPYCDFNSHVSANIDQTRWSSAYSSEIRRFGAETEGRTLDTVFFGGGTPSLMDPELVASMLETIRATWRTSNSFEVTLEANPTSVEASRFQGYRDAGVNRISMGIQALNDTDLRALGRMHTVSEALEAFDIARSVFSRISFDLIYARQNQTLKDWQAELSQATTFAADHLSLYQLTIEDGTAFGDRAARGLLRGLPEDDSAADMYFTTQEICEAAGLPAYEVSNHAAVGAESRHNLIYWQGGDYVGVGPGAHGRLTLNGRRFAIDTPLQPGKWLSQVETTGNGDADRTILTAEDQAAEYLMMGLRLREGISLTRHTEMAGEPVSLHKINMLQDLQLIDQSDGRLFATDKGRPILNALIRELLP
ncbi:MAG: radical SAM family heme chaperone HemW [Paracoccaceae bacterium]